MINNRYKILIIEDEEHINNLISALMEANGYQAVSAYSCRGGQMMFASHRPDLVILDLGLPDRDGMTFLREVRQSSFTPIIVLSARSDERDKVEALNEGANDYVTKPFSSNELVARVRSALRIATHRAEDGLRPGGRFEVGELVINYDARLVTIAGNEVKLTQTEYNIIAALSEHAGKVMTYSAIIKEIWGPNMQNDNRILRVNMANIRRKLERNPAQPEYIFTEIGIGYRMIDAET